MQAERVDFIAVPTKDRERCNGAVFNDPDGNSLLLHRRYAPYRDGTQP
jgi:hypothetical protein